jgi:hypothetical protein
MPANGSKDGLKLPRPVHGKVLPTFGGIFPQPTAFCQAVGLFTIFNVKGNTYRLLTVIAYDRQVIGIVDLLTHAEYDKDKWK